MGPKNFQKNFQRSWEWENLEEAGLAGGRGVSSGRVRVGINPTRVELLSVIVLSYTATAAYVYIYIYIEHASRNDRRSTN